MSDLRTIVYVSSAVEPLDTADLEALLTEARKLNRRDGITGILLYADGNIMQCIEGPADKLTMTFARIRASRRHSGIVTLLDERIPARCFVSWDMGLAEPTASELLRLSTAHWERLAATQGDAAESGQGLELLQLFWRSLRRTAVVPSS